MAAAQAFRKEFNAAKIGDPTSFESADARRLRYALYWAMYENSAYDNVHSWAKGYRLEYGLYKFVRSIYNPAYRLGEFWASHLMGGILDPEAGDGLEKPSALPVLIPDTNGKAEPLREAIARLWQYSNWQIYKDNYARYGAVMGDVAIKIVDDAERGRTYLDVVNPSQISDLVMDRYGNCKGYRLDCQVEDPDNPGSYCTYGEVAERLPGTEEVQYTTYRDGKLCAWGEQGASWTIPYGFVPLVAVQHHNVGLRYGWSEFHPSQSKMREADDIASSLGDHIRRSNNPVWFFAGMDNPNKNGNTAVQGGGSATTSKPQPGREEMPAIYAKDAAASAMAMVANLDVVGSLEHLKGVVEQLEKDYPELRFDNMRVNGDASGKALRIARQPAEAKVKAVRANYDDGLKRAQQMAVAIGGWRGYEGFQGFDLASYDRGDLDHSIGDRNVFPQDQLEAIEEEQAFWTAAQAAVNAGMPLEGYLRSQGWDDNKVQTYLYTGVIEQ